MDLHCQNRIVQVALLVFCVSFAGCGGEASDQPDLGLVQGTVTFEGSPLAGASITFMPDSGRPASGTTDAAGKYELIYIRNTPGCKIGHSKVMITSVSEGENEMEAEGDDAPADAAATTEKLPAKYNTKTELEADVKAGENTIDFDLKK
ncbi:carboxypeptidase-like regulatory domain-containing protein [Gimesia fumaroli]|uniref:Carboxypeptidase regulatory-like domain-containing protein n=1 Tax=Gimesia fumaroli TaxID=2527976 RepID=A0A518IB38_9PLAN|nr:carboxypeptidase-like regulatory domain-containing protein [Gimesia fumaroli]QDV50317.1 hypothetical protein Enr17x_23550 [Gimesia fumaroli]